MSIDVKSTIYKSEKVDNKERLFGSTLEYYPVMIKKSRGSEDSTPLLFTENELEVAADRAARNPEDLPDTSKNFFEWLFG